MTDTSPEMEVRYLEMWRKVPPTERLGMGCEMFSAARELAMAGIRRELGRNDPKEMRRRLFLRFYGSDFTPEETERILRHLEQASLIAESA